MSAIPLGPPELDTRRQRAARRRAASQGKRALREDIQGLRAVAVLLVVIYHAGASWLSGGFIGVDVFFVISGFLITGHLLTSLDYDGSISFGDFYARRVRRILPASMAVLLATTIAAWLWLPPQLLPKTLVDIAYTALYVPNVRFAQLRTDYLAEDAPSIVQQYWSLGVEEQFYLFWPLVLLLLVGVARARKRLLAITTALVLLSFSLSMYFLASQPAWSFFSLPTRAWQLGVGALLAIAGARAVARGRSATGALWLGGLLVVLSAVLLGSETDYPGLAALAPTIGAALLIMGGQHGTGPVRQLLGSAPMRRIGDASYSIYLVHWPLLTLPALRRQEPLEPWAAAALAVASLLIGWLCYRYVEQPFRRPGSIAPDRRFLVGAIAVPVTLAALAVSSSTLVDDFYPLTTSQEAPQFGVDAESDTGSDEGAGTSGDGGSGTGAGPDAGQDNRQDDQPDPGPTNPGFVPSNLTPPLWSVADDIPTLYDDGCHKSPSDADPEPCAFGPGHPEEPVVALIGDSHAAQWFPTLDELRGEHGFTVRSFTKSGCGLLHNPEAEPSCEPWRDGVIGDLTADPPEVIILAQFTNSPSDWSDAESRWEEALDGLPAESRIVVLADTPYAGVTPAICLSENLTSADECDLSVTTAFNPDSTAALSQLAGVDVIDLTSLMCGTDVCPVIIDDVLVYRDASHITAEFARRLAPALAAQLVPLLET